MYASEQSLNGPLHPGDVQVITDLANEFRRTLPSDVTLVCPLSLGNHVDHQLTRLAMEQLGHTILYYADFPYVLRDSSWINKLQNDGWKSQIYPISEEGLLAWQDSICAHGSQISTFWPDQAKMRRVVSHYMLENRGIRLWNRPTS